MKQWLKYFDNNELSKVLDVLTSEYEGKHIEPKQKDVFKAFKLCPLENLKIIVLGQDPYPQKGVATGLAFANNKAVDDTLSPSLLVLSQTLLDNAEKYELHYVNPNLEYLAEQGVLLLNTSLTVELGKPGSHTLLWRNFIKSFLYNLSNYNPGLIYICLGKQAQSFIPYINNKFNHILCEQHPAYYARIDANMPNTVFEETNRILHNTNNTTINWYE